MLPVGQRKAEAEAEEKSEAGCNRLTTDGRTPFQFYKNDFSQNSFLKIHFFNHMMEKSLLLLIQNFLS